MAAPQMVSPKRDREPGAGEMETCSCTTLGSQEDKNGMVCLDSDSGPRGGWLLSVFAEENGVELGTPNWAIL